MKHCSSWRAGIVLAIAGATLLPACRRKPAEVNAITPSFAASRNRAPLGSAIEVTYTWTVEPTAKRISQDHHAFVHFLDSHGVILFTDDHLPTPPSSSWEPGKTYTYGRTVFVPIVAYVGPVEVRMGLQPVVRGERMALKGEDAGLREYRVAKMESLPQTENIFLVYKEGWHNPESATYNASIERTWTKREALVSFKNPKKDVVVYLEADTNSKAFEQPPVLTVAVGDKMGTVVPIADSEIFLKKIKVRAADLGSLEWVDLKLSMNQSFVPKLKGVNATDERELGVMVYHLYVGEADSVGNVPGIVDATSLPVAPATTPAATKRPAPKPAAKK